MEEISIYAVFGSYFASFTKLYLMLVLSGMQNILRNKRFWISFIISGLYILISFLLTNNVAKVIIEFIMVIMLCIYTNGYKQKKTYKIIMSCFIVWVGMLLIEVLFYMVIFTFFQNISNITFADNILIKLIISNLIFLILSFIFYSRKVRKMVNKLTSENNIHNCYTGIIIILSVCIFSVSVYLCLFKFNVVLILIALFFMISLYTIVVLITIRKFNEKNRIQAQYDVLLTNLSEYENLLDIQRISNHENKNQLLVIKGMINKNDNNVSDYIDSIIDAQYTDNDSLIMKTNRIPSGGLRGLIYYKMLAMKEKEIKVDLEIDKNVRNFDFAEINIKTNQELCKIVGVFLDNAIQEVENMSTKKINIFLEYCNDQLIIKISNNYNGNLDLEKMENRGYTTKGKGHGYGLNLVRQIISNNDSFKNEKQIHGKMFTQIIKLKI